MNANMIAKSFVGHNLGAPGSKLKLRRDCNSVKERFGGPAFFHEEILQTGAIAAFAQHLLVAEDLCDGADNGHSLLGQHECIETNREMRLVGEPAANAQRRSPNLSRCASRP